MFRRGTLHAGAFFSLFVTESCANTHTHKQTHKLFFLCSPKALVLSTLWPHTLASWCVWGEGDLALCPPALPSLSPVWSACVYICLALEPGTWNHVSVHLYITRTLKQQDVLGEYCTLPDELQPHTAVTVLVCNKHVKYKCHFQKRRYLFCTLTFFNQPWLFLHSSIS